MNGYGAGELPYPFFVLSEIACFRQLAYVEGRSPPYRVFNIHRLTPDVRMNSFLEIGTRVL